MAERWLLNPYFSLWNLWVKMSQNGQKFGLMVKIIFLVCGIFLRKKNSLLGKFFCL